MYITGFYKLVAGYIPLCMIQNTLEAGCETQCRVCLACERPYIPSQVTAKRQQKTLEHLKNHKHDAKKIILTWRDILHITGQKSKLYIEQLVL